MPQSNANRFAHEATRGMRPDAHRFVRPDWRRFVRPGCQDESPFDFYKCFERKYSPDQPRVPAGNPDGGQWTSEGGGGSGEGGGYTRAQPGGFSPSKAGWHHYNSGPNKVCRAELRCSRQEMADQLARYSVPGQDPAQPVQNGKTYPVYEPDTGIYVGSVKTIITDGGLTIINRTLPGHIFYDGAITRRASQSPDGSWHVTTEGMGNNVIPGMSTVNQEVGPEIFGGLDRQIQDNIERHHGKGLVAAVTDRAGSHRGASFRGSVGGEAYAQP